MQKEKEEAPLEKKHKHKKALSPLEAYTGNKTGS